MKRVILGVSAVMAILVIVMMATAMLTFKERVVVQQWTIEEQENVCITTRSGQHIHHFAADCPHPGFPTIEISRDGTTSAGIEDPYGHLTLESPFDPAGRGAGRGLEVWMLFGSTYNYPSYKREWDHRCNVEGKKYHLLDDGFYRVAARWGQYEDSLSANKNFPLPRRVAIITICEKRCPFLWSATIQYRTTTDFGIFLPYVFDPSAPDPFGKGMGEVIPLVRLGNS